MSCLVHLSDLGLFDAFNTSYKKHFPGPPGRRLPVEVTVIASKFVGCFGTVAIGAVLRCTLSLEQDSVPAGK